jgi:hypothetical protein
MRVSAAACYTVRVAPCLEPSYFVIAREDREGTGVT